MDEKTAFLKAICADADDDAPRVIYADWLEEHGNAARAEFIRLQCEWERASKKRKLAIEVRELQLLREPNGLHQELMKELNQCGTNPNLNEKNNRLSRYILHSALSRGFPSGGLLSFSGYGSPGMFFNVYQNLATGIHPIKELTCLVNRRGFQPTIDNLEIIKLPSLRILELHVPPAQLERYSHAASLRHVEKVILDTPQNGELDLASIQCFCNGDTFHPKLITTEKFFNMSPATALYLTRSDMCKNAIVMLEEPQRNIRWNFTRPVLEEIDRHNREVARRTGQRYVVPRWMYGILPRSLHKGENLGMDKSTGIQRS